MRRPSLTFLNCACSVIHSNHFVFFAVCFYIRFNRFLFCAPCNVMDTIFWLSPSIVRFMLCNCIALLYNYKQLLYLPLF